jgi:transcriptional regulator GlxA family with amidase domain
MANAPHHSPRTVGILIFDNVEVLDFCGPFEVFSTARPPGQSEHSSPLFQVFTIAEVERIIHCRGNLLVQPHYSIENHPPLDILLVPGGWGTRALLTSDRVLDWIAQQDAQVELTTSVCTGALLLAERGILNGRQATTHWGAVSWMREHYPKVEIQSDMRYVDTGTVITSAGVSAGIDMALHVVARLHGEETAAWTAREMEYDRYVAERAVG